MKKITILEKNLQSEENIQKANELKEIFKKSEIVNELKDRFSKNDRIHYDDGSIQKCFLQNKNRDFNEKDNVFDYRGIDGGNYVSFEFFKLYVRNGFFS